MSIDRLDITPFKNVIQRLEEGLVRFQRNTSDEQIRDGLIQRFEFTYELSHKTLKRYLEYTSVNPKQFDEMTFQDLIRTANEHRLLLGNWPNWRTFRSMRSISSHTYNEDLALEVIKSIPRFIEEVKYLRDKLEEHLA